MQCEPTLIIGDVHGCLRELDRLLVKGQEDGPRRLIFVGDLINKGPNSMGVLKRARALRAEVIQGNHERAFLKYVRSDRIPKRKHWNLLLEEMGKDWRDWIRYIENWPSYIETDHFLVVHAGLQPGKEPEETDPDILANIRTWDGVGRNLDNERNPPWFNLVASKKPIIFGHWAKLGLFIRYPYYGLDSGCVYGKYLTALRLPEMELVQVKAERVYQQIRVT